MPNLSFDGGWTDIWIGNAAELPGREAQQPNGWQISALPIGSALLSAGVQVAVEVERRCGLGVSDLP